MSSNRIFPSQSPYTCWQFVKAGYSKSDEKHLEDLDNLEYLDHKLVTKRSQRFWVTRPEGSTPQKSPPNGKTSSEFPLTHKK